ncbi:MAG TPA: hypothetical protein VFT64_04990 [Rickettsiales bacterium]|nr:hypothetical protein [Rickettsiales bacterium]
MKKLLSVLALLATVSSVAPAIAQDAGNDMNADRQAIRNDMKAINQEGQAIKDEKANYNRDQIRYNEEMKERAAALKKGDKAEAARLDQQIDKQKRDLYRNRQDILHQEADIDRQRQDAARQKDDIRKDMHNLQQPATR